MIGRLDRRVTFIQEVVTTGDSNEDKVTGWEVIDDNDTVWARKIERSGSKFVQDDRITFVQQTDWVIRYRSDLNVRMRLVYDTQVYSITNIAEHSKAARERYSLVSTTLLDNIFFT